MITGTYIFYEDGKEIHRSSNVITKFGKRFLTNLIAGNVPGVSKDIAIGIDPTAATVDDTRLGFEFYRTPVILSSTDIYSIGESVNYSVVYKATLPQDVSGIISEVGLYPGTRTSLIDYDSKFISDFDNFLDWMSLTGSNALTSPIGAKIGDNVLRMYSDGTSSDEYYSSANLDLSGYSLNDTLRLAYYKHDNDLDSIKIKFYHTATDLYEITITPPIGTGYQISDNIPLSELYASSVGSVDPGQISKIGIVLNPKVGLSTSISLDGLRINDEDTFDPIFGLISRSVIPDPYVTKIAGRQLDIEYKIDLSF